MPFLYEYFDIFELHTKLKQTSEHFLFLSQGMSTWLESVCTIAFWSFLSMVCLAGVNTHLHVKPIQFDNILFSLAIIYAHHEIM